MTRADNSGQILPLAALVVGVLMLFLAANFQISRMGIDRIDRQKRADALVMRIANEQARALNAVAALNEALSIIQNRLYIFNVAWTGACACAAVSLGTAAPCTKACNSLSKDAPKFLKACVDMGEKIADWQDAIVQWGGKAPERIVNPAINSGLMWDGDRVQFVGNRIGSTKLLIQRANLSTSFSIPPPYQLNADFFQNQTITLRLATNLQPTEISSTQIAKKTSVMDQRYRPTTEHLATHDEAVVLTKAKISGGSLGKMESMEFEADLVEVGGGLIEKVFH